ncbi:hypothetical protein CBC_0738 [Clostridium botulinum C str. Eklund]|nr:hypothetical protein CBC_0738 [Clostridium botulinum C str. Eklund]
MYKLLQIVYKKIHKKTRKDINIIYIMSENFGNKHKNYLKSIILNGL